MTRSTEQIFDEARGMPLRDQPADGSQPLRIRHGVDRGKRVGKPRLRLADGNTDAPLAEVESE